MALRSSAIERTPKILPRLRLGDIRPQSGFIGSQLRTPCACIAAAAVASPDTPSTLGASAILICHPTLRSIPTAPSTPTGGDDALSLLSVKILESARASPAPPRWITPAAARSRSAVPTSWLRGIWPFSRASLLRLGVGASVRSWKDSSAIAHLPKAEKIRESTDSYALGQATK